MSPITADGDQSPAHAPQRTLPSARYPSPDGIRCLFPKKSGHGRAESGKMKEKCIFFAASIAGFKIMRTFAPQSREIVRILK